MEICKGPVELPDHNGDNAIPISPGLRNHIPTPPARIYDHWNGTQRHVLIKTGGAMTREGLCRIAMTTCLLALHRIAQRHAAH